MNLHIMVSGLLAQLAEHVTLNYRILTLPPIAVVFLFRLRYNR